MYLKSMADVRRLVKSSMKSYMTNPSQVARYAGCCRGTVAKLIKGDTKSPHMLTVLKILTTLGFKIQAIEKWMTMEPTDERLPNLDRNFRR